MNLQAICALSLDEELSMQATLDGLYELLGKPMLKRDIMFDNYAVQRGYATDTYIGRVKPEFHFTELELSMICDGGFSHFGGSSVLKEDGTFKVEIYTD